MSSNFEHTANLIKKMTAEMPDLVAKFGKLVEEQSSASDNLDAEEVVETNDN